MTVEAGHVERAGAARHGVSGAVIQVLLSLVRSEAGESGVAQALALAGEERSFPTLGDVTTWTPAPAALALFNAAALVTGDSAVGLHVGEEVLWTRDATNFAGRVLSLGSPEVVLNHVGSLIGQFDATSEAVALEVADDHALVQVSPVDGEGRNAHLCELTRGLLAELPTLFGLGPAMISERECAARGGRSCRYAVTWRPRSQVDVEPGTGERSADQPGQGSTPSVADAAPPPGSSNGSGPVGESPGASTDRLQDALDALAEAEATAASWEARAGETLREGEEAEVRIREEAGRQAALAREEAETEAAQLRERIDTEARFREEAETEAARLRERAQSAEGRLSELADVTDRLEGLLVGGSASALHLFDDVTAPVAVLAECADRVVTADRYLLMLRVAPGTPIELHHRGLDDVQAERLAAELWQEHPEEASGSRVIVDIASPRRRYGRLAAFTSADAPASGSDERILGHFARYAANFLDDCAVLGDARRSDATARTLLSFSEELSGLTTLTDAVQRLADAVPVMTGCDQATVYLWDRDSGVLTPTSRTGGLESGDAYTGPIVSYRPEQRSSQPGRDARPDRAEAEGLVTVRTDTPVVARMVREREVMVLDARAEDPQLRALLSRTGTAASVVAPLFAAGAFIGVIAANFGTQASDATIHDPDLHERLLGLADQAATAIQNLELLEKVSHMAWHDSLTGLPNRRLFEDRVKQELVRSRRVGEPVCMFFVDLDNFKTVNDTFGHATGDDLIQQVALRLVETVRSQDTVARVGGDEFAILLPGLADQLSINLLAERMLEGIHTPFLVFGEEVTTSASIGMAIAPEHGDSYDDLLNRADEAMYRAKDLGRNAFEMYHFSPDPTNPGRRALDDRELYVDLIKALDGNEFFLLYQPYIDLRTAQVVGVEALVRWDHPSLGILEPSYFIALAEKSDLIVALDSWVLWQACRQLRAWLDLGLDPLRLSVNLASRDLANPDLFQGIHRTLQETGVDPTLLELEITRRVVLDTTGPARENIDRLRRLGVRFTIDDFGSGNSSLNRIGTFPVSTLKIDQSFVQVLGPDAADNSLVSAIISMADRLGLATVAEGVETSLQSRVLLQRGCTTAQGYYFSPPLVPEDVERMLTAITPAELPDSFGEPTD